VITNYHWPICWMNYFILFVRLLFSILAFTTVNPVYLLSNKGRCDRSSRGCLHLRVTWSYLWISCGLKLPYTRFCFLSDHDCVLHVMSSTWNWFLVHEIDFIWQSYLSCIVDGIQTFALYLETFWWKFLVKPNYFISP
jgi:hypothetical protein